MSVSKADWRVVDGAAMESEGVKAVTAGLRPDMHSKVLIGEIPLPRDLTPSFAFAKVSLKVRNSLFQIFLYSRLAI